jgi:hypothetical protein
MEKKEYAYLINIIEERRNKLFLKLNNTFYSKKIIKLYLRKYDALLMKLYTKYGDF